MSRATHPSSRVTRQGLILLAVALATCALPTVLWLVALGCTALVGLAGLGDPARGQVEHRARARVEPGTPGPGTSAREDPASLVPPGASGLPGSAGTGQALATESRARADVARSPGRGRVSRVRRAERAASPSGAGS